MKRNQTEIANVKAMLQERFISYKNISDFVKAKIKTEMDSHCKQFGHLHNFTLTGVRESTEIVSSIMGSQKILSAKAVKESFGELVDKMADANMSVKYEAAKKDYQIKKLVSVEPIYMFLMYSKALLSYTILFI